MDRNTISFHFFLVQDTSTVPTIPRTIQLFFFILSTKDGKREPYTLVMVLFVCLSLEL